MPEEQKDIPKYRKIPVRGMGVLTEEYLFLDYKELKQKKKRGE